MFKLFLWENSLNDFGLMLAFAPSVAEARAIVLKTADDDQVEEIIDALGKEPKIITSTFAFGLIWWHPGW